MAQTGSCALIVKLGGDASNYSKTKVLQYFSDDGIGICRSTSTGCTNQSFIQIFLCIYREYFGHLELGAVFVGYNDRMTEGIAEKASAELAKTGNKNYELEVYKRITVKGFE